MKRDTLKKLREDFTKNQRQTCKHEASRNGKFYLDWMGDLTLWQICPLCGKERRRLIDLSMKQIIELRKKLDCFFGNPISSEGHLLMPIGYRTARTIRLWWQIRGLDKKTPRISITIELTRKQYTLIKEFEL